MATATYFEQTQKIYIAFYQRPADPAGLRYWAEQAEAAGGNLSHIIDAFAASPEAVGLYGSVINDTTIGGVVDSLYLALFNRTPDVLGRQFYIDGFGLGVFSPGSIALAVLVGAQGSDAEAINNKLQVANEFMQQVDGRALSDPNFGMGGFTTTYAGDAGTAAARAILAGVTLDPATVLTPAQVTNVLRSQIAQPGDSILVGDDSGGGSDPGPDPVDPGPDPVDPDPASQSFALTVGIDTLVGAEGDDIFTGTALTFQDGDSMDGKGGVNTLKIVDDSGEDLIFPLDDVTVKNIQHLEVTNTTGYVDVAVQGWQGLQSIVVDQQDKYKSTYIETNGNARSVSVQGGSWYIDIRDGANPDDPAAPPSEDTLAHVAIEKFVSNKIYIQSDVLSRLSLSDIEPQYMRHTVKIEAAAGERALALELDGVRATFIQDATATTLHITASGADSDVYLAASSAKNISIDGNAAILLRVDNYADNLQIISTNTAGVDIGMLGNDVTFTGGSGRDTALVRATTQTIDMGGGDDFVDVEEMLGTGGQLQGGAGTDALYMQAELAAELSQAALTDSGRVQGFEVLHVYGPDTPDQTYTIDLAALGGIGHVVSSGTWTTSPLILAHMADAGTLELAWANQGPIEVVMANAAGASDTFHIKLNGPSYVRSTGAITVDGVEIIHITTTNSDPSGPPQSDPWGGVSALRLQGDALEKIVLAGNHGVNFDQSDFGQNFGELDASGVTGAGAVGDVTFEARETNKNMLVKTGEGDDRIDMAKLLNSAAAAAHGATISTGAGDDEVIGSSGVDTITLGEGEDAYVLVDTSHSTSAAPDVITDFKADTDRILVSDALAQKADGSGGFIELYWFNVGVFDNAVDASAFIASAGADGEDEVNIALDSSTGWLYLDVNDDGVVDSVIHLMGVSTIPDWAIGIV